MNYDGIYNKQNAMLNDMDWWQARDSAAKLYYYVGISGQRWKLEGEAGSYFANASPAYLSFREKNREFANFQKNRNLKNV